MSGVSVCTCGNGGECPRTCAGAQLQKLECAIQGHLTARRVHREAWGHDPDRLIAGEYCYRCGDEGE